MNIKERLIQLLGQRKLSGFFYLVNTLDKEIDNFFGIHSTEERVDCTNKDLYAGLDMRALSTSYLDYFQILNDLPKDYSLADLGAGYCRGTFLAKHLNRECISVEIDKSRSLFAKRKYPSEVLNSNLERESIPDADAYFIYLPWGSVTNNIIKCIYQRNKPCSLYVIESHGDFIENLSLYKEFKIEKKLLVSSQRHNEYIYKFNFSASCVYKSIDIKDYNDKTKIAYWLIKFKDQIGNVKIKTQTTNGDEFIWEVNLKEAYACLYNKEASIFFYEKSRYLQDQYDSIILA